VNPTIRTESHLFSFNPTIEKFNPTIEKFNPTIDNSIPLFVVQSHYSSRYIPSHYYYSRIYPARMHHHHLEKRFSSVVARGSVDLGSSAVLTKQSVGVCIYRRTTESLAHYQPHPKRILTMVASTPLSSPLVLRVRHFPLWHDLTPS
jgi:hypothetical protein